MEAEIAPRSVTDQSEGPQNGSTFLFNITTEGLKVLLEKKMDVNGLYMLHLLSRGVQVSLDDLKVKSWIQTLKRKKYISAEGTISLKGKTLLKEVDTGMADLPAAYAKADDPFEKWWFEAYPATDHLEYNGRVFPGTQSKRVEKEECRQLFWDIINEGEYSWQDIYWGTRSNVNNAKELSLQSGRSEIHFIANSKRYLLLRKFVPFVEAGRKLAGNGMTEIKQPSGNKYDFDI